MRASQSAALAFRFYEISGLVPVHRETFENLMELVERRGSPNRELAKAIEQAKRELGLITDPVPKPRPTYLQLVVNNS